VPLAVPPNKTPAPTVLPPANAEDKTVPSASPPEKAPPVVSSQSTENPLDRLEQHFFGQMYSSETQDARLQRLENFVFGTKKSGDAESRISLLSKAMSVPSQTSVVLLPLPAAAGKKLPAMPTSGAQFTTDGALKEGENFFQQNAFHAAEDSFTRVCEKNPRDQRAHFWLALTRMRLYDYDGAKQEMQMAFALNPFSDIGQKARANILDLSQLLDKERRQPVDSADQMRRTIRDMRRQAASLQAQKYMDGALAARWARYSGQMDAQRVRTSYGDYYSRGRRLHRIRINSPYDVSNLAMIRSNYALTDSYVRGANARRDAADRQQGIQDYMNSALREMGDRPHPGQPRLRAFGSNLYVHYYGTDAADSPPAVAPDDAPVKAVAIHYGGRKNSQAGSSTRP